MKKMKIASFSSGGKDETLGMYQFPKNMTFWVNSLSTQRAFLKIRFNILDAVGELDPAVITAMAEAVAMGRSSSTVVL